MLIGFLVAGLCGTSVSLLASLPPVSVYGQMMGLWSRILYRYGVGMAGTAVGCGFLSLGMIELLPKQFDFVRTIDLAPQDSAPKAEPPNITPDEKKSTDGTITTGGTKSVERGQPLISEPKKKVTDGSAAAAGAVVRAASVQTRVGDEEQSPTTDRVATSSIAILLALGILLGFTERALGSFEDQLFPGNSRDPKPTGS